MLADCISGLPLFDMTTPANVADFCIAIPLLDAANDVLSFEKCAFIADKGYDVKAIYNHVRERLGGDCFIPLNTRATKKPQKLPIGNRICDAGIAMHKDVKISDGNGAFAHVLLQYAFADDLLEAFQLLCIFFLKTSSLH